MNNEYKYASEVEFYQDFYRKYNTALENSHQILQCYLNHTILEQLGRKRFTQAIEVSNKILIDIKAELALRNTPIINSITNALDYIPAPNFLKQHLLQQDQKSFFQKFGALTDAIVLIKLDCQDRLLNIDNLNHKETLNSDIDRLIITLEQATEDMENFAFHGNLEAIIYNKTNQHP